VSWAGDGTAAVREIDDDEGRRLVRIVCCGTGSMVTWRRAQLVLLSAQGMDAAAIAKVAFTTEDRVRDVIGDFSAGGSGSLCPKYAGGRPRMRATCTRTAGVRHLLAACELGEASSAGISNHAYDERLRRVLNRANVA
jgi:hypothetical protein